MDKKKIVETLENYGELDPLRVPKGYVVTEDKFGTIASEIRKAAMVEDIRITLELFNENIVDAANGKHLCEGKQLNEEMLCDAVRAVQARLKYYKAMISPYSLHEAIRSTLERFPCFRCDAMILCIGSEAAAKKIVEICSVPII